MRKLLILNYLVDLVGIEPTTSSMPWKRAPSCATGPLKEGVLQSRNSTIFAQQTTLVKRRLIPIRFKAGARYCFHFGGVGCSLAVVVFFLAGAGFLGDFFA